MKIKLSVEVPACTIRKPLCGVYLLSFDNGMFYIGSSLNLKRRAATWRKALLSDGSNHKIIWVNMANKVKNCAEALFSVVEIGNKENLRELEEKYLQSYSKSPLFLNTFLYVSCPVVQYDKNMNAVAEYKSIKSAAKILNIKQARIRDVVSGRNKSHKGFVYKEAIPSSCKKTIKSIPKGRIRVFVDVFDGQNKIYSRLSIKEANQKTNSPLTCIKDCIRGKQKTSKGFKFVRTNTITG